MGNSDNNGIKNLRKIMFKAITATIKAVIIYIIYFVLWGFIAPISEIVPGFQQMVETFVMVYIIFTILGTLTSGTIFQYFLNVARALFVILYLIFSLKNGIVSLTFQNVNLMVDLHLFMIIATSLSLLGLAKSMLQAINYMNEKVEYGQTLIPE